MLILQKHKILQGHADLSQQEIFNQKTKGSKKFRNFFNNPPYDLGNIRRLENYPNIPRNNFQLSTFYSTLSPCPIPNKTKWTFYKFLSNTLITNYQASKIFGTDPRCSYCLKIPYLPAWKEDPFHLFGSCPATSHYRCSLKSILISDLTENDTFFAQIFLGSFPDNLRVMSYNNNVILAYVILIFEQRLSSKIDSSSEFTEKLRATVESFCSTNLKLVRNISVLKKTYNNYFLSNISAQRLTEP